MLLNFSWFIVVSEKHRPRQHLFRTGYSVDKYCNNVNKVIILEVKNSVIAKDNRLHVENLFALKLVKQKDQFFKNDFKV